MTTFKSLQLNDKLLEALDYMGFEKATPIQEEAIPQILNHKDLLACAQTGTGKTAAFILPVLHALSNSDNKGGTRALIIAPTRELAIQIDQQIQGLAYFVDLTSIAVYGGGDGDDFQTQKNAFKNGVDIIVATPGKLMSHMNMGYAEMKDLQFLILDEADRMLDIGFYQDIISIRKKLPEKLQTLLFSATMPSKIKQLSKQILHQPYVIELSVSKPAEGVLQAIYLVQDEDKTNLLVHLLKGKEEEYQSVIVFCSTKKAIQDIVRALKKSNFKTAGISSDLDQDDREEQLRLFKARRIQILVATDVISRGIDIQDISLVVNYHVPNDAEDYVHRVGRTARAASTGVALTLVSPREMGKFASIERLIETEIPKIACPEEVGKSFEWRTPSSGNKGKGKKKYYKKRKK